MKRKKDEEKTDSKKTRPYGSLIWSLIVSVCCAIGFVTRQCEFLLLGFAIFVVGFISFYLRDFLESPLKAICMILIAVVVLSASAVAVSCSSVKTETTSIFQDMYTVDAPFGILWRDTSGSAGFFVVFGAAHIDTALRETYNIKYFADSNHTELKTVQLDAEQTSVIIDGTFQLEYRVTTKYLVNPYFERTQTYCASKYYVHIPVLPNATGTTEEYKVVG